jgi:hypothetical protein
MFYDVTFIADAKREKNGASPMSVSEQALFEHRRSTHEAPNDA